MANAQVKPHFIVDSTFRDMPVASFEVPSDWHTSSRLQWVFGQVVDPASDLQYPLNAWARAEDSIGDAQLERFPELNFYFFPQAMFAAGQRPRMFGALPSPPMPGAEAIARFLLPWCRAGLPDLRIVGPADPREYVALLPLEPAANPEPVGVRIEYSLFGEQYEEEILAVKTQWDVQNLGGMGVMVQTNWTLSHAAGLRALKGTLNQRRPEMMRILGSARPNMKWVALSSQVRQQLSAAFNAYIQQGYDMTAAAGAASRQISANNDALLGQFEQARHAEMAQWNQQRRAAAQAEERSVADRFSEYIRGVNTYADTDGSHIQHSNTHSDLWKSASGRYHGTSDPSFDPNVGSTETWQRLRRV